MDLLFRKLDHFVQLTDRDRALLKSRVRRVDEIGPHRDVVIEGEDPHVVNVILEGWVCRYKQLEDGRRQIIAFLLPGDMCDPCVFYLDRMSHALGTLTPAKVARIPQDEMAVLLQESPDLARALWFDFLVSTEVQREASVSLGRRSALERLAHLFCELLVRLRALDLLDGTSCDMPITQADLGDALGLSTVHVNRTLQDLRAMRLVEVKGRRLIVRDERALQSLALFDPTYLHLQRDMPHPSTMMARSDVGKRASS